MTFNPVFSSWLIMLIVLILTIFLLWLEWKKPQRLRVLRIIATIIMMIALMGILLRPGYTTKKSSSILLLTSGYSKLKVDSILLQNHQTTVMHVAETLPYKSSMRFKQHELSHRANEIKTVLGNGIPRYDLDRMEDVTFDYMPATPPPGIISLFIPRENVAGRKNTIKGTFNNLQKNGRIYLEGPRGKEDSVNIYKGLNHFELSFIPKREGQFTYNLLITDSLNTYHEALPVSVEKQRPLNVLFLQSYPTFETQALKNFLGQKNHSVVVRSQVSKNNFRYEYINHGPVQAGRLSGELLRDTDLVIADDKVLSALTPAEKSILTSSIRSGLGLLSLSATSGKSQAVFFPFQTTTVKKDTATIRVGSNSFTFPTIKIRMIASPLVTPLHKNKSGILSGYVFLGAGKIGFQLLQETYPLALSGDSTAYSALWTPILEGLARPDYQPSKINIATPFPWYEDEPIDIEIISSRENISLQSDSTLLPLKEDIAIDNVWRTRTWGEQPGWHTLKTNDGTALSYYISRSDGWKSLSMVNQQEANKLFKSKNAETEKEIGVREEVPPLIFYLIFLFAAGFIWLAPKL